MTSLRKRKGLKKPSRGAPAMRDLRFEFNSATWLELSPNAQTFAAARLGSGRPSRDPFDTVDFHMTNTAARAIPDDLGSASRRVFRHAWPACAAGRKEEGI